MGNYKDKLAMIKERYLGTGQKDPDVSIEEPEADIPEDVGIENGEDIEDDGNLNIDVDTDKLGMEDEDTEDVEDEPRSVYSAQYESGIDGFTDSRDELDMALSDFKNKLKEPETRISDGERGIDPVRESEAYNDGSEQAKEAQKFGFLRNKIDDWKDTLKMKSDAKSAAYEDYLKAKPKVLQDKYARKFNEKLRIEGMTPEERAGEMKGKGATGLRKVAEMLGGNVHPEKLTGISGSVFGPLPHSRAYYDTARTDSQGRLTQGIGGTGGSRLINQFTGTGSMPEKYAKPGVVGSQVPKYQSAPKSAAPGTTWSRVTKVDARGKKRSYLRKSRIPGQIRQSGQMQPGQKVQGEQQMQQPKMGVPGIKGLGGFGGFEMAGFGKMIGPKQGLEPRDQSGYFGGGAQGSKDLSGYFGMGQPQSIDNGKDENDNDNNGEVRKEENTADKIQRYMRF